MHLGLSSWVLAIHVSVQCLMLVCGWTFISTRLRWRESLPMFSPSKKTIASLVTKDWIIQHVTPQIFARTNDDYIAFVFGKAILLTVFAAHHDDDEEDGLPPVPPKPHHAQAGDPNPIVRKTILIGRPNANGNVMISIREPVQQGDGNVDDHADGGAGGGNQVSTLLQQQCLQPMQQLQTDQQKNNNAQVRAVHTQQRQLHAKQRQLHDALAQMRNLLVGHPPSGDPPVPPPNLPALPNAPLGNDAGPVDDNYVTLSHGPPTYVAGPLARMDHRHQRPKACARLYEVFGQQCTVSAVIQGIVIQGIKDRGNELGGLPEDLRLA